MIRTTRLAAVAGALGFAAFAALGPSLVHAEEPPVNDQTIGLSNNPANVIGEKESNCESAPVGGDSWHFVLTPNGPNAGLVFNSITLDLGSAGTPTVSGTAIFPVNGQTDNVYVLVPVGAQLTSLEQVGTSANYDGLVLADNFNLSHVCDRPDEPPVDEPPTEETTATTQPPAEETTTTPVPTTTAEETTTTAAPVVESTAPPAAAPPAAAPPVPPAPLVESAVQAPAPVVPVVAGELPETGSSNTVLALGAALSLGAGVALVAMTRRSRKA